MTQTVYHKPMLPVLPRHVGKCRFTGRHRRSATRRKKHFVMNESRDDIRSTRIRSERTCRIAVIICSLCFMFLLLIKAMLFSSRILRNLGIFVVTLAAYMFWLYRQFKDFNSDTCRQGCEFSQKRVKTSLVEQERSSWIVSQLTDVTPYWCECPCGNNSRKKTKTNDEKQTRQNS